MDYTTSSIEGKSKSNYVSVISYENRMKTFPAERGDFAIYVEILASNKRPNYLVNLDKVQKYYSK